MGGWAPESFGALNAADYDETQDPGTTEAAVEVIADLAGSGRVLELAVGTGRIALPLAARGLDVTGLDASPEMIERLRAKPGGADLPVVIGDMAEVAVDGPFDHVFVVFNTLFNLTSQEAQLRCFAEVAERLAPGGTFLIEVFVFDPARYRGGQDVRLRGLDMASVALDAISHDPVTQRLKHQRIHVGPGGTRLVPLVMRYAWPAELDLMARLAGLTLRDRWGGWDRSPFTGRSRSHVSVYQLGG